MRSTAFFIFIFFIAFLRLHSQGGTWVWMNGSKDENPSYSYGAKGIPDSASIPPALYEPAHWIDKDGKFWVFGGLILLRYSNGIYSDEHSNDLWKYDPDTNLWTWFGGGGRNVMSHGTKGVPSLTNWPMQLAWCPMTWTDDNGDLWLYGGRGYNWATPSKIKRSNMLWRYNIASGMWTWMSGDIDFDEKNPLWNTIQQYSPFNTPGGRSETNCSWVDKDNNLWFFGGFTMDGREVHCNDMWKYSIANNQWICMKGPAETNNRGHYGVKGVEASENVPPSRWCGTSWKDEDDNFYIFGGSNLRMGVFNDVWKYNTHTNNWTWIAGPDSANGLSVLGNKCVSANELMPSPRNESRSPKNDACKLSYFMFGGSENWGYECMDEFNDLWEFDIKTNQWKWLSGTDQLNPAGCFGIKGIADAANVPPGIQGSCMWLDRDENVWMFGGLTSKDYAYNPTYLGRSTLWKFIPDRNCHTPYVTHDLKYTLPRAEICPGDSVTVSLAGGSGYTIVPQNFYWQDTAKAFLFPDSTTTFYVTGITKCNTNDTTSVTIKVSKPLAAFDFVPSVTTIDNPLVQLSNLSTPSTIPLWINESAGAVINDNNIEFSDTGTYCVALEVTNGIGCKDTTLQCITVYEKSILAVPDAFTPNGDGINDYFTVFGKNIIEYQITIYDRLGETVYFSNDVSELNDLSRGWNGLFKNSPQATVSFAYNIVATDITGKQIEKNGSILLLQ